MFLRLRRKHGGSLLSHSERHFLIASFLIFPFSVNWSQVDFLLQFLPLSKKKMPFNRTICLLFQFKYDFVIFNFLILHRTALLVENVRW